MLNFSKDTNMSNARTRVCLGVLWRAWQQCLYYYRMRVINNRHWILQTAQMGYKTKLLHTLQEVIELAMKG